MTQMSKLAKQKSTETEYTIETLGKLIISELCDTQNASNDCVCIEAKEETQVLMNAQDMTKYSTSRNE
jgi:hypothetical protein